MRNPHSNNREKEYEVGDYIIKKTLGQGTFGKVKLGIHKPTNEKVAIKILEKCKIIEKDDEIRVKRELEMMPKFNHNNVILVTEIFSNRDNFYIVMEYCEGGELFNYIVKKRRLAEEEAAFFFYQIISGLEYIHSLGIVHRDLKPENLLLGKDHILKIIDFGLSNYFSKKLLVTPCGSPCYASPEMVSGNKYNGFRIDIWSTGIILYAMLCGYLPFEDKDNEILFKKILRCKLELPSHLSHSSKDLMLKILVTNPEKRITIPEIKRHPFYLKGKSIFNQEFSYRKIPKEIELTEEEAMIFNVMKTEGDDLSMKNKKNHLYSSLSPPKEKNIKDIIPTSDKKTHNKTDIIKNIMTVPNSSNKAPLKTSMEPNQRNFKDELQKQYHKIINTEPNLQPSFKMHNPSSLSDKKKQTPYTGKPQSSKSKATSSHPFSSINNINISTFLNATYMNSMRYPMSKTISHNINAMPNHNNIIAQKHQLNNKITIKNTVINVNMIEPFVLLQNFQRKAQSRTKSSMSKQIQLNKSERKKPELKFYDLLKKDNLLKTQYGASVIKTHENYPIKTMGNEQTHSKYNSMKINMGIDNSMTKKRTTLRTGGTYSGIETDFFLNMKKFNRK